MIPDDIRREVYGDPEEREPSFTDGGLLRQHTARRPGPCADCPIGRGVRPTELYNVWVGIASDGGFYSQRMCASMPDECHAAEQAIKRPAVPRGPSLPIDPDNIPF